MGRIHHALRAAAGNQSGGGGALTRAEVSIAMACADTSHASKTNTEDALVAAGFSRSNITAYTDTSAPPPADIILIVRAVESQSDWDLISPTWQEGTPVVFGSANVPGEGTGRSLSSTFADLTGTFEVVDNLSGTNANKVVDASHQITDSFGVGEVLLFSKVNWGFAIDGNTPQTVGQVLATGDPTTVLDAQATLISFEVGVLDLNGAPVPARSVVWSDLYGGQSAYTADGAEWLGSIIDWCVS